MWGYPTVGAYYRDASSVDSLLAIRVPFFAINAEDDPVGVIREPQLAQQRLLILGADIGQRRHTFQ
jgi:predicted alpha/beta-fold hydrolase